MAARPPRWYFSFRSPYSWLAWRDLVGRYPAVAEAIEWVPFWEPDPTSQRLLTDAGGRFPYVEMSAEKHRYILQDVRRLARARGLTIAWPVDRTPCWEVSHLAYLVAHAEGRGREFVAAVYHSRWERGEDISQRATVGGLATQVGLSAERLANAVDDPDVRRLGLSVLLSIWHDGVFGVPFFIRGFDKFWGLDRLPSFVAAMNGDATAMDEAPELVVAALGADSGHAGGCG